MFVTIGTLCLVLTVVLCVTGIVLKHKQEMFLSFACAGACFAVGIVIFMSSALVPQDLFQMRNTAGSITAVCLFALAMFAFCGGLKRYSQI